MDMKITTINNIFNVLTYPSLNTKSATVGFWIDGGASKETNENNGIAHVLEHMMFKGTKKYNTKELVTKLEELGAQTNAYTSFESVAYYVSVAPTDLMVQGKNNLMEAMELLFDLLLNSTFPEEELKKEKDVIIQELKMYEDDLEERCYANLHKITYNPDTYLHREIIGLEPVIRSFTSQQLKDFMKDNYNKIYFVITGNFDEKIVIDYCKKMGDEILKTFKSSDKKDFQSIYIDEFKEIASVKNWANQAQVNMGWKVSNDMKNRKILNLISCIFGGGMSSILFQKIRDDLGLVYAIYSTPLFYRNDGSLMVHFKTFNHKVQEVIDLVNKEIMNFINDLTDEHIQKAKNYIISSRIKRTESNQSQCFFLGEKLLENDHKSLSTDDFSFDDYIYECNDVTKEDIKKYWSEFLNRPADKISKILTE
jgi:predicted Zn-dependent peptidase